MEAVEELRKYPDAILWSFKLCLKAAKSNKNKNVPLKKNLTCEYLQHHSMGMQYGMVCQNSLPYLHPF